MESKGYQTFTNQNKELLILMVLNIQYHIVVVSYFLALSVFFRNVSALKNMYTTSLPHCGIIIIR